MSTLVSTSGHSAFVGKFFKKNAGSMYSRLGICLIYSRFGQKEITFEQKEIGNGGNFLDSGRV
jgi:hypothetical protein